MVPVSSLSVSVSGLKLHRRVAKVPGTGTSADIMEPAMWKGSVRRVAARLFHTAFYTGGCKVAPSMWYAHARSNERGLSVVY